MLSSNFAIHENWKTVCRKSIKKTDIGWLCFVIKYVVKLIIVQVPEKNAETWVEIILSWKGIQICIWLLFDYYFKTFVLYFISSENKISWKIAELTAAAAYNKPTSIFYRRNNTP